METSCKKRTKKTTIGGQALIEGILMRGPERTAIAIRTPEGDITVTEEKTRFGATGGVSSLPLVRGVVNLFDSLSTGMKALTYSAGFYDEEKEGSEETFLEKVFGTRAPDVESGLTLVVSVALVLGLFFFLPSFITGLLKDRISSSLLLNLVEGAIRILLFLIYIVTISRSKDIYRVFQYHGAEHKTVACYEVGEELTVENVSGHSILHPRCGTSFLFMVMLVSVVTLSLFGWPSPFVRFLVRIAMLPVIVSISYEINRAIGRSDGRWARILSAPGLWLQKIATVKEPTEDQIEVAIAAIERVIPTDEEKDRW